MLFRPFQHGYLKYEFKLSMFKFSLNYFYCLYFFILKYFLSLYNVNCSHLSETVPILVSTICLNLSNVKIANEYLFSALFLYYLFLLLLHYAYPC